MKLAKWLILPMLLIFGGCSFTQPNLLVVNQGKVQTQDFTCNDTPPGVVTLVVVKATKWWDILDSNSKGYCTNFGKPAFIPLSSDANGLLAEASGPLGSITQKMTIPIIP
jgi:hypothetical protein